jgi:hypothetical protein
MLVYNLPATGAIFRRYGGVDGSAIWVLRDFENPATFR